MSQREFQESRTSQTQFDVPVEDGTIKVIILDGCRALIESMDRVRIYNHTLQAYQEGLPLNIKGIEYSFWGHMQKTPQGWLADKSLFYVTAYGVNTTKLREQKVRRIVEQAMNQWEQNNTALVEKAYRKADLINVNNDIKQAETDLHKAQQSLEQAQLTLTTLLNQEQEILQRD